MKVQLIDRNENMCREWTKHFNNYENITIYHGEFFGLKTDCVVSPANSFGFMDGGLDALITAKLGQQVQRKLKEKILTDFNGELLVGQALILKTDNLLVPYCISAPTMRVPMILGPESVNVYLASKAIFRTLIKSNEEINTVTISGLGTGVGRVPYDICARQMKKAYDEVILGIDNKQSQSWLEAQNKHQNLYRDFIRDLQFK